jgi:hypothetical protein
MAAGITRDFEAFHQRGIVYHKTHDYAKVRKGERARRRRPLQGGVMRAVSVWACL